MNHSNKAIHNPHYIKNKTIVFRYLYKNNRNYKALHFFVSYDDNSFIKSITK
jgi:hypothetical protein